MTIEIHTPELERLMQEEFQRGQFQTVDDLLTQALRALREKFTAQHPEPRPRQRLSAEEWTAQFDEWADSFPEAPLIPDEALRRENLYPDRS